MQFVFKQPLEMPPPIQTYQTHSHGSLRDYLHLVIFFFSLIGELSDPEKTRCKCPPKRIRDGYKSDCSNHFRRWSGPHSRQNWTSVNASGY